MGDFFSTLQFGSFVHSASFTSVVLLLLIGLAVGGLVAGWLAKGHSNYYRSDLPAKETMIDQSQPALHIALQVFKGDRFGFFGEKLLGIVTKHFGSLFFSNGARVSLSTIGDTCSEDLGDADALHIGGRLEGSALEISFSQPIAEREGRAFECYDFPLLKLHSLSPTLPGHQQEIFLGAVYGGVLRGQVLERGRFAVKKISLIAETLEAVIPGMQLTQPELYEELCVVCSWCHLFVGLQTKQVVPLQKALSLYQIIETFEWGKRDPLEWAGIKANEASAALAVTVFDRPTVALSKQAIAAASEAQDYFDAELFPDQWGGLVTVRALAQSALGGITGAGDVNLKLRSHAVAKNLDQAIDHWRRAGQKRALPLAYYAKSRLALAQAKRCSGVQDWQQAEHALLCAIEHFGPLLNWLGFDVDDFKFELAHLSLSQGVQFGDTDCLQRGIQHFSGLADTRPRSSIDQHEISFALAQSYFHLGAMTNEKQALAKALHLFNDLKDQRVSKNMSASLDCFLGVCRARLALLDKDMVQASRAISGISALLGTKKTHSDKSRYFAYEDLLCLRVRLREMIFLMLGNEFVLEKAVSDQRTLVGKRQESGSDLDWAVQVSRLVELLMLCPELLIEQHSEFDQMRSWLEEGLVICKQKTEQKGQKGHQQISFIEGSLRLKLGRLLAAYGRVHSDLPVLNEGLAAYEGYLSCSGVGKGQDLADVLQELGQLLMDLSEHHGQHQGLGKAQECFSQAYELYLQDGLDGRANCARRLMENAQAAKLAYYEPSPELGLVHLVR